MYHCYDGEKWTMIILSSAAISLTVGLVLIAHGQTTNKPDFVLEMSNASRVNDKLTLFAIEGESYKGGICPSGQCNLEGYIDASFSRPNPDRPYMSFDVGFILRDMIPNPNVGPNEKSYLERFSVSNYGCRVDDFIEDNGQEIYVCHDGSTTVTRTFDSRSWNYDTIVIFDAKKNTLRVVGNYTGS